MDTTLQLIGGIFFLLNKIFLAVSERALIQGATEFSRKWRIASWVVYLIGLPAWVIIFIQWKNWIAAGVEASGAPAMVLGLVIAVQGKDKKPPRWLDYLAIICIPLGFGYSLYDFGGITTINQWLEIGLVLGFLVGTYMLAKENSNGYLWYVLMHTTCGLLMYIQGYPWLLLQQLLSLIFIVDAYQTAKRLKRRQVCQLS